MRRHRHTFASPRYGCGLTAASLALSSALAAQQPFDPYGKWGRPPRTTPTVQCYAISPDTGSRPPYLPEHLVLGANPVGGGFGLRIAAVSPGRFRWPNTDEEDTLRASWRPYGRLYAADSIYVEWFIPISMYGPVGTLYAQAHGDSLSGRAIQGGDVIHPGGPPWLPIHGRSSACPPAPVDRVVLERTACFGVCPAYRVGLDGDGVVAFTGTKHVATDTATKRVPPATLDSLFAYLDRAGFFRLNPFYTPGYAGCKEHVTDHPFVTLSVTRGGRTKSVEYYYGCLGDSVGKSADAVMEALHHPTGARALIADLTTHVDSVAGTSQWIVKRNP